MLTSVADVLSALEAAGLALLWPALAFAALALAVRGLESIKAARAAAGEVSTNVTLFTIDALLVAPALALILSALGAWMQSHGLFLVPARFWTSWPQWAVACVAVFAGDFIGYWRHRLEHTPPLWPAHTIHHSDRVLTWTTSLRFHPINRFSTALVDTGLLALLGFPAWALVINNLVRHYYGLFIHSDLPWTYGLLGRLFVSPAMHRWHHARDRGGDNFATVFSVFDQAFGTYYSPGPCTVPLGVTTDIGRDAVSQLLHPFQVLGRYLLRATPLALFNKPG